MPRFSSNLRGERAEVVQAGSEVQVTSVPLVRFWCKDCYLNVAGGLPAPITNWGRAVRLGKLRWGVLRLVTPVGDRYVRPTFWERLYLLWVFRNFSALPQNVLSRRAHTLVENLCMRQHSGSQGFLYAITDQPVIGTVERVPQFGREQSPADAKAVTSRAAFSRHNS